MMQRLNLTWQVDAKLGVVIIWEQTLIPLQWLPEEILTARPARARRRLQSHLEMIARRVELIAA